MNTLDQMLEVITAHKEGRAIEYRSATMHDAWLMAKGPTFNFDYNEYRVKPEPKPDKVGYIRITPSRIYGVRDSDDNCKVTFDGETGALKAVEILK